VEAHQIRYFLAACDSLNFTRAANGCGVTVATLSRAIKGLEDELGGQLFRRERHLIHLTDLGRLMQQHLGSAQAAMDAAQREASRYARADAELKLGVVATMPSAPLIAYLQNLRAASPELQLHVWESHCAELSQSLRQGEIDIAVMSLPDYDDDLRAVELMREHYMIAFPAGHRFEALNVVSMAELEGQPYVKRLHCEFPSNFARLGVAKPYADVSVRYVTEREDWVQAMVEAGLGVTVMPEFLPILPGLRTRRIVDPAVWRTISLVTVGGRPHSGPVQRALEVARRTAWPAPSVADEA
jgi:DNA-binding transcriptional LysR family regulator